MRISPNLIASFSVMALVACGGAAQDSKEADVWAGFKGTYAGPAEPRGERSSAKAESGRSDAKSKTEAKEAVGGYILVEAESFDEAMKIASEWPLLDYEAFVEVRPVLDLCVPQTMLKARMAAANA